MTRKINVFILIIGLLLIALPGCSRGISQTTKDSTSESTAVTDKMTSASTSQTQASVPTTTPTTASASTSQTQASVPTTTPTTAPVQPVINKVYGNGGNVVEQGDWLYFRIGGEDAGLYKVKPDGTNEMKLYEYSRHYYGGEKPFFIIGDWIYFTEGSCSEDFTPLFVSMYKMKTDGTDLTKLLTMADTDIQFLQIEGEWICFGTRGQYSFNLYRLNTDGTGLELILEDAQIFALQDGWVYAFDDEKLELYRIYINGTQKQILSNTYHDFVVEDDWIYYKDFLRNSNSDECKIYKMNTNGSGKVKLCDDLVYKFYLDQNEIFCEVGYGDEYPGILFKMQTDGTGRTEICKANGALIDAVNGWLYLWEHKEVENPRVDLTGRYLKYTLYRIKIDGSSRVDLTTCYVQNMGG